MARTKSGAGDLVPRVRQVIATLLAGGRGYPDIQLVARTVGTSVRTLQRRLGEKGLRYVDVVQQARCAAARELLGDPRLRVGDVAEALGYSDHAHFTRAFLRWTGQTPTRFRCQLD